MGSVFNIWRMDVRAHVNNGISIMFDRAKLALKARTPFSINTANWVCLQKNVCFYLQRQFFSIWSFCSSSSRRRYPWQVPYRIPVSLQWVCFVFLTEFWCQGPIHLYAVHSAGSFSSCPLIPFRASWSSICLSLFVEPFPFNDLKLHISHSLSQYKRTRKGIRRRSKRNMSILLGLYSGLSLEHKG